MFANPNNPATPTLLSPRPGHRGGRVAAVSLGAWESLRENADSGTDPAAEIRHLPADDTPLPAMRLVKVGCFGRGVLRTEVVADPGIQLHGCDERVIAEQIAEVEGHPYANTRPEPVHAALFLFFRKFR